MVKNFVEFFAGVGLVREGLQSSGWNCVLANDISVDKKNIYEENFGSGDFLLGDVWDLSKSPDLVPDDAVLYTASFPCTDLSLAGSRAGLDGKESGSIGAIFNIINSKKKAGNNPKIVLLENVQGFLTSHQGKDVVDVVARFSDLGYCVDIVEIDAIKFSAQSRPRVFVIAVELAHAAGRMIVKSDNNHDWEIAFSKNESIRSNRLKSIIENNLSLKWGVIDFDFNVISKIRLYDVVEKEIPDDSLVWWSEDRKNKIFNQMSKSHKDVLNALMNFEDYKYATVYRRTRNGTPMAEIRYDGYAGCLRTPRGGSSKQILIRAGKGDFKVRFLTPREYARLQGVRDSFKLPENDNKGYFAMGDAVCVPVIEFIAKNILNEFV